jgi:hypothetical protein
MLRWRETMRNREAGRKQLRKAGTTQLITSARRIRSRHTHARKTFIFLASLFQSATTFSVLAMITLLMLRHYLDQRRLPRALRHCSALHFLRYSPTDLSHTASSFDSTLTSHLCHHCSPASSPSHLPAVCTSHVLQFSYHYAIAIWIFAFCSEVGVMLFLPPSDLKCATLLQPTFARESARTNRTKSLNWPY